MYALAASLAASLLYLSAFAIGAPTLAHATTIALDRRQTPTPIEFYACAAGSHGTVSQVTVQPCQDGNGSFASPCTFYEGQNYTITLTYTPDEGATLPRANLIAYDPDSPYNSDQYPYSGQSFDGCKYTACPIQAGLEATYTYHFRTLNSDFNELAINMTQSLAGPSIICAGFPVNFVPATV